MTTTSRTTRRRTVVGTALLGSALAASAVAVATPAQAAGTTTINAGTCRPASTPLSSGDGFTVFGLQSDGNLVARIGGGPVWTSGTAGTNADRMCLQTDGNFVVYKGSSAVWQSHTAGSGTANRLTVQNDGNVVIYTSANKAVWQTGKFVDTLVPGGTVQVGQQLTSRNGTYRAAMQSDGNLVVRTATAATWSTGTAGRGTSRAVLQSDGNFVVYAGSTATWNAKTGGRGTTRVVMQNDGNLVAYAGGTALWSSKTGTINTQWQQIVSAAEDEIGQDYVYAGGDQNGPTMGGFDCSGLAMYAIYQGTGIVLYHNAQVQHDTAASHGGVVISNRAALQPGDLVFFGSASNLHHVGIYVGGGYMIDAPTDGVPVGRHQLYSDYYDGVRFWH